MVKIYTQGKCRACNTKFGLDKDGHSQLEYYCNKQPKWEIKIDGKIWLYCSDRCLNQDFKRVTKHVTRYYKPLWSYFILIGFFGYKKKTSINKKRWVFRKNPNKKFRLRLTNCYKKLGRNIWDYKDH